MDENKGISVGRRKIAFLTAGLGLVVVLVIVIAVVCLQRPRDVVNDEEWAEAFGYEIESKLSSEANYNPPQAMEDYKKAYEEASGMRKFYVGLEYAQFACDYMEECELAVRVLEEMQPPENWLDKMSYYSVLLDSYKIIGNEDKISYYEGKINELAEGDGRYVPEQEN